jgi:type I restriction enzyme, R subunit
VVEGLIYSAGEGHQKAINVLLESGTLNGLIDVLNRAGLYRELRGRAEQEAVGSD